MKRHAVPSRRAVYSNGDISSSPPNCVILLLRHCASASLCFTAEEVWLSSHHTHRRVSGVPGRGLARIALHARAIAHKWPHLRPQSVRGEGCATHRPAHCVACRRLTSAACIRAAGARVRILTVTCEMRRAPSRGSVSVRLSECSWFDKPARKSPHGISVYVAI
jgi:hypothetical protein